MPCFLVGELYQKVNNPLPYGELFKSYCKIAPYYIKNEVLMRQICLLILLSALLYSEDIADNLYAKPKLTASQLSDKQTGSYFTGLPIINYDADKGLGYGARVYWHDNGDKEAPLFEYTPYKYEIYGQFLKTTNGWQYHVLHFDAPYIEGSLFRITSELLYEKNTQANYFGTTASSLGQLSDPNGVHYETAKEQQDALDAQGSRYYNRFLLEKPTGEVNLARDLFGGLVRFTIGVNFSYATVETYENSDANPEHNDESLLYNDNQAAPITGYKGGWDNALKLALVYDSRDFAPNPKNGNVFDLTVGLYGKALGSAYNHQRYNFSTRNFYTPDAADYLTLAFRWVYSVQVGDTPFYNKNTIGFADEFKFGLGGFRTLRGYQQDRFVADVKTVLNFEPRFSLYEAHTYGQSFEFIVVPFVDAGKVFDDVSDTDLSGYKYTYGAGMRIAWNQATIIMIDYGQSVEDSGLYINFGHIF